MLQRIPQSLHVNLISRMTQHRFFSAFLGLVALGAPTIGTAQISRAADVNPAANATPSSEFQIAQATSSSENRTLFVTGTGQANVPADQAVLLMSFYPNSYYGVESSDPSTPPAQPQVKPSDLSAATEAAKSAGGSQAKAYPDFTTPGAMRVRIVINQPTEAKIDQVIESVNTAIIKTNRYTSSGVAIGYGIRDCGAAETSVRQAAMSDANRRAVALATVSGVQMGDVMSLSESMTWGTNYTGACPLADEPASYADISTGYPYYDPSVPPAVRVVYSLSVTYGLR